jgi:arylsulfatase A-like enzyme
LGDIAVEKHHSQYKGIHSRRAFLKMLSAGAVSAVMTPCFSTNGRPIKHKPNIIMLFADDVGYGDLSCYGHPTIHTPNLDRLAAEGVRLTSFYSAPSCVPARVQLLLGQYPPRVNLGRTGSGGNGGIPEGQVTLAQVVKNAGYRTAMMGKWHLGYAKNESLPVSKGFDYWFGLPYSNDMRKPWVKTDVPLWLYENTKKVEHPVDQDTLTTRYTEHAVDFIQQAKDEPFFLYLAYSMAHLPIHTTEKFRGHSRAGLYGDVIQTIDWSVGQITKALRQTGNQSNTIVVFASDNGPWLNLPARMLQEGNLPWHAGLPGHLSGAKHTTLEGGPRVPCIVRWPGQIPAGRMLADMAATMDLYVTLGKAAGGKLPDYPLDGYDLMPFLKGETRKSPRDTFLYFTGRGAPQAVRVGPWKLRIVNGIELFNLDIDPSERYNRAEEKPELVEQLTKRMRQLATELGSKRN